MNDEQQQQLKEELGWLKGLSCARDVSALTVVRELRAMIEAEPEGTERRKVLNLIGQLSRQGIEFSMMMMRAIDRADVGTKH